MGRTPLYTAIVVALLGIAPGLQAETEHQAAVTAPAAEAHTPAASSAESPPTPAATTPAPAATEAATPSTIQSTGDTLAIPKTPAKPAKKRVVHASVKVEVDGMPGRGATMAEVEKRFGKPKQKLAAVGKPPITRWIYDNYTVYFEHQYVIHSVKDEAPAPQTMNESVAPAEKPPETAPTPMPEPASEMTTTPAHESAAPAEDAPVMETPETASTPMTEPATDMTTPAHEPAVDAPSASTH